MHVQFERVISLTSKNHSWEFIRRRSSVFREMGFAERLLPRPVDSLATTIQIGVRHASKSERLCDRWQVISARACLKCQRQTDHRSQAHEDSMQVLRCASQRPR